MEIVAKQGTALEQTIKAMCDKIMSAFDEEAEDGVNIPLEEGANITGILTAMQLAVYSCLKRFRAIAPDSSWIDGMEFSNRLVIQYLIENCRVEKVDKEG